MKKFITYMLALCLIIPCAFIFSACKDKDPKMEIWDGRNIEVSEAVEGVVTIETAEELAGLAKEVNDGETYEGITIKLACDMDLANLEWTPIGYGTANGLGQIDSTAGAYFKGIFDGQNKTIKNLKITEFNLGGYGKSNASAGIGLFGNIFDAEIKNLKIKNANVYGNHFVGCIVGFSIGSEIDSCEVENVEVNCVYDNDDDSGDKAGAVVGFFSKGTSAKISNCVAKDSSVKADRDAGQIIGCLDDGASQALNKAENVLVSCNESSANIPDYTKGGTNIRNYIVGRVS